MSDIKVTIVGAAIAVSVAGQPIAITTVGQQGPSGPAVPALSNTNVLFSDSNQVGASPNFTFDKTTNAVTVTGNLQATNYLHHSTGSAALAAAGLQAGSGHAIGFSSIANATGTMDTMLHRGGAGILEQRNGANAQEQRWYETFTDTSNYSRLALRFNSSIAYLRTEAAGTGTQRSLALWGADLLFVSGGSTRLQLNSSGHLLPYPNSGNNNAFDLGSASWTFRTGYFGSSLFVNQAGTVGAGTPSLSVYGPSADANWAGTIGLFVFGTSTMLGSISANINGMLLATGGTTRWSITNSGHLTGGIDNTYDIGAAGANRPRSGFFGTSISTPVIMGANNVLEQRNGANAQTFRLAQTYTDASNNEFASMEWNGGQFHIRVVALGTGVSSRPIGIYPGTSLFLGSGGFVTRWELNATGHLLAFADNSYDIGAPGSRPRTGYFGTSVLVAGLGGIGYAAGAGGTVVQATNKSTGVTLNKPTGVITMASGSLAANGVASFVLTNSTIAATDHVIVTVQGGATGAGYLCTTVTSAGAATVHVRNVTAGALDEPVQLRFTVLKSVNS